MKKKKIKKKYIIEFVDILFDFHQALHALKTARPFRAANEEWINTRRCELCAIISVPALRVRTSHAST